MLAEQVDRSSVSRVDFDQVREKMSLFGGLSDRQVDLITPYLKVLSLTKDEVVFRQGQLPCNVYIVLSGSVCLEAERVDGSFRTMHYQAGDCFGETAVIGIQPQLGRALAREDSQVLVLSRTCLLHMANIDQELFGILMMNIAREVSRRLHCVVSTPAAQNDYPIMRA